MYILSGHPQPPIINNTEVNGTIVRGMEDQHVSLLCISRGGYPKPSLVWYKGPTPLQPLTESSSKNNASGTYTVKIEYTFLAKREDDRVIFTCKTFLNATDEHLTSSVMLYLSCKYFEQSKQQHANNKITDRANHENQARSE